jgi:hypothetical protein
VTRCFIKPITALFVRRSWFMLGRQHDGNEPPRFFWHFKLLCLVLILGLIVSAASTMLLH